MERQIEKEDILCFYSGSADKSPGKGIGEYVSDISIYSELEEIPNWRRMLSTLWSEEPFVYGGATFTSTEHALMRDKFLSVGFKNVSWTFERESKTDIGLGNGLLARKNRKIKIMTQEQLEHWENIRRDRKKEIYRARYGKGLCNKALLFTRSAQLWSRGPRIKPIRCTTLEEIRCEMLNN